METVPVDVLLLLSSCLEIRDLGNLERTNKFWRTLLTSNQSVRSAEGNQTQFKIHSFGNKHILKNLAILQVSDCGLFLTFSENTKNWKKATKKKFDWDWNFRKGFASKSLPHFAEILRFLNFPSPVALTNSNPSHLTILSIVFLFIKCFRLAFTPMNYTNFVL